MTYRDGEPGVLLEIERLVWTAHGHRRLGVEGLYDGVPESFHAGRTLLHVTTYVARNLHQRPVQERPIGVCYCKFGDQTCYSYGDNAFFLRDCFFTGAPCTQST